MSQLVKAEVNSGNRIKSGTRIKLRYKDSWTPSRIAGMRYGGFAVDYFTLIAWVSCARSFCDFSDIDISPNLPRFRGPRIEALKYTKEHI